MTGKSSALGGRATVAPNCVIGDAVQHATTFDPISSMSYSRRRYWEEQRRSESGNPGNSDAANPYSQNLFAGSYPSNPPGGWSL